jgi:hypothetical protein
MDPESLKVLTVARGLEAAAVSLSMYCSSPEREVAASLHGQLQQV